VIAIFIAEDHNKYLAEEQAGEIYGLKVRRDYKGEGSAGRFIQRS